MFWEKVIRLMEERNISQAHLSKFVGKEKSQVNKWIQRGTIPSADYVVKMAHLFNTTVEDLVLGDNSTSGISDRRRRFLSWVDDMTEEEMESIEALFKVLGAYGEKLGG
jgi:transcriptional regulator with XRE-family HTH domain